MKSWILKRHLILFAAGLAMLYWILEAVAMMTVFDEGAFAEQISPPAPSE